MEAVERRSEWRRGWPIVTCAALGLGAGPLIYQYISSLFIAGMIAQFHWSRTEIASIGGMMAAGAVSAPLVGYLADRFGVRPVMLSCSVLVAFAYAMFVLAPPSLNNYRIAVGLIYFCGVGCGGITYSRIVNQWFRVHRGAALAVAASGVAVGAFVLPLVLEPLIQAAGWRAGYAVLSAMMLLVCIPAIVFLCRPAPPISCESASVAGTGYGAFALRPAFWLILAAMFLVHISASALLTHFVPVMTGWGLGRGTAVKLLSFYAACAFAGRLGVGFLLDGPRPTLVAFAVTTGAAVAVLFLLLTAQPSWIFAMFVVALLGIQMGAELDLLPFFVARYIGLRSYSSVYGLMTSSILLSSGLGTQLYGLFYDRSDSYSGALQFSVGAFLLAALCFLALGWTRRASEPVPPGAAIPAE